MSIFTNMKSCKFALVAMLMLALAPFARLQAQTITVNSSPTTTCEYVPISGYWNDSYQQSEFIILSGQIHDNQGNPISKAIHSMTFYLESPSSCSLNGTYQVYLKDVTQQNHNGNNFVGVASSTVVYQGSLTISNSRMTITFATDFYHSSSYNLLVGIKTVTPGSSWCNTVFYGVSGENITAYSQAGLHSHGTQTAYENYNNYGFCPEVTLEFVDAYTIKAYTYPSEGGTLNINGGSAGTYKYLTVGKNTVVTLKRVSTNSGYTWKGWAVGSPTAATYSTSQTINYTVTSNVTLYAVYNVTAATINVNADTGGKVRINSSGSWVSSTSASVSTTGSCTINAQADDCYTFSHWTNSSGTTVSNSANYTLPTPITANTYTAHFTQNTYNITATAGTGGKVKINGSYGASAQATVNCGSGCTLYAQANDCYTFQNWTNSSGTVVSTSSSFNVSNVIAAATYTANFTLDSPAEGVDNISACNSYTWRDGITYYSSTSGEHTYTVSGATAAGCDSVYTLNLTINSYADGVDEISACDSYTWRDGITYYSSTSGEHTYTVSGATAAGCDSVYTLNLTINSYAEGIDEISACGSYTWRDGVTYYSSTYGDHTYTVSGATAAGCDSVYTLNLTLYKPAPSIDIRFACDSLTWIDGVTYTENNTTATYVIEGGSSTGCDSVVMLNLTINHSFVGDVYVSACEDYIWEDGNGVTYTESGEYEHNVVVDGCDSTTVLHLTINHNEIAEPEFVTVCNSYEWNDSTYTESGIYTHETPLGNECTLTETLNLTINEPVINNLDVDACEVYVWNNITYVEDGDYTQTFIAANSCDSIVNIHLTLKSGTTGEFDMDACEHYIWNNIVYSNSGDFNQTFAAANGCDSVVTMHLTIKMPVYHEFDAEECPGYTWNGSTYTMSGDYVQTFVGSNNCDSVVTMHLSVKESPYSEFVMVACDSYVWDGVEYDSNGNYPHVYEAANGCDSTAVMLLTINTSPVASITGDLWVATGVQDSTVLTAWGASSYLWSTGDTTQSITVAPNIETTYYVTVTDENGCSSTAEVTVINSTGIEEASISLNVYPNPTNHVVNIEAEDMKNICVTDVLGQVLIEKEANVERMQIDMSPYASGQYFLQVQTSKGLAIRKIVKK